jgi:hypothetical protein
MASRLIQALFMKFSDVKLYSHFVLFVVMIFNWPILYDKACPGIAM